MHKLSLILTIAPPWDLLPQALNSLRKQSLGGFELVCVVPEGTPEEVLRSLRRFIEHRRGKLVCVAQGTAFTQQRNAGLAAASGKYVAFLHSKNRFTPRFLAGLLSAAERENAALVVGRQRGFGALGRHSFSAADALSLRREGVLCTDERLLWNPSVSNKLYRLEDIRRLGLSFQQDFGFAADALFTLSFAFGTQAVAGARKGFAEWRVLYEPLRERRENQSLAEDKAELESYISAYGRIKRLAEEYFDSLAAGAGSEFLRKEAERRRAAYLDSVRSKLLTVLIYRYYRRFFGIPQELLLLAARAIFHEYKMLSESGRATLLRYHADILIDGAPPKSLEEAKASRKLSVLLCGQRKAEELAAQIESLAAQTLPFFELLCDEELKPLVPPSFLNDPRLRFLACAPCPPEERQAAIKQLALEQAGSRYLLILERPALLDPKALQRHWRAIKKQPEAGFTTAPYSRFDGTRAEQYPSASLFFDNGRPVGVRERPEQNPYYPLDLLWENKLLRLRHLRGVRFSFSRDSALDCLRLYQNSSFVRLAKTALYLSMTREELMALMRREAAMLPPEVRGKTRGLRLRSLRAGLRHRAGSAAKNIRQLAALPGELLLRIAKVLLCRLPLREDTLFCTERPDKNSRTRLSADLRLIYGRTEGRRRIFAHAAPLSLFRRLQLYSLLARSRVIVTDCTIPALAEIKLRPAQRLLQMWHACGAYKRFALDAPLTRPRGAEERAHSQYTAAVVSSEYCRDIAAHAFGLEPEQVLALGSPHTDTLLDAQTMEERRKGMYRRHPILRDKKVYLYCPTSRAGGFDPKIRWKNLSRALERDELFIIHRHPLSGEGYISGRHYQRVRDYTAEPLADVLSVCSVLVTDYSAVVQEAALLGKPVLFYCPDWEEYERDFYLEFPDELPGAMVTQAQELPEAMRAALAKPRAQELAAFCQKQMGACDGQSTERVLELLSSWRQG
jgi:CDP-glycerol glycerophosphotransferase (TagB/SpsB family)/glycosyltransferase involved in cell wall biosynthesis